MQEQRPSSEHDNTSKNTSNSEGQQEADEQNETVPEVAQHRGPGGACRHPHCRKKAKQSTSGVIQYCMSHMREHGQQPSAPRCQVENCPKYAQQSIDRQRIYCVLHMRAKGIVPAAAVCQQEFCSKEAKVSVDGRRLYCILHMKGHGLQPRIASCQHPNCTKQAQPSREGPAAYCKAHMREHNLQPRVPLCQHPECTKVAKQSQSGAMLYCIQHMKEHGLPVKAICSQACCTRFARLSLAGTYAYCEQHMPLHGLSPAPEPNQQRGAPAAAAAAAAAVGVPPDPGAALNTLYLPRTASTQSHLPRSSPASMNHAPSLAPHPRAKRPPQPKPAHTLTLPAAASFNPQPPAEGQALTGLGSTTLPQYGMAMAANAAGWPPAGDPAWQHGHPGKRLRPTHQAPGAGHGSPAHHADPGARDALPPAEDSDSAPAAPATSSPGYYQYPDVQYPSQYQVLGQYPPYMHTGQGGWMSFPLHMHPMLRPQQVQWNPSYGDVAMYAGPDPYAQGMVLNPHADPLLLPAASASVQHPEHLSPPPQQHHHHHQQQHFHRQQQPRPGASADMQAPHPHAQLPSDPAHHISILAPHPLRFHPPLEPGGGLGSTHRRPHSPTVASLPSMFGAGSHARRSTPDLNIHGMHLMLQPPARPSSAAPAFFMDAHPHPSGLLQLPAPRPLLTPAAQALDLQRPDPHLHLPATPPPPSLPYPTLLVPPSQPATSPRSSPPPRSSATAAWRPAAPPSARPSAASRQPQLWLQQPYQADGDEPEPERAAAGRQLHRHVRQGQALQDAAGADAVAVEDTPAARPQLVGGGGDARDAAAARQGVGRGGLPAGSVAERQQADGGQGMGPPRRRTMTLFGKEIIVDD